MVYPFLTAALAMSKNKLEADTNFTQWQPKMMTRKIQWFNFSTFLDNFSYFNPAYANLEEYVKLHLQDFASFLNASL